MAEWGWAQVSGSLPLIPVEAMEFPSYHSWHGATPAHAAGVKPLNPCWFRHGKMLACHCFHSSWKCHQDDLSSGNEGEKSGQEDVGAASHSCFWLAGGPKQTKRFSFPSAPWKLVWSAKTQLMRKIQSWKKRPLKIFKLSLDGDYQELCADAEAGLNGVYRGRVVASLSLAS